MANQGQAPTQYPSVPPPNYQSHSLHPLASVGRMVPPPQEAGFLMARELPVQPQGLAPVRATSLPTVNYRPPLPVQIPLAGSGSAHAALVGVAASSPVERFPTNGMTPLVEGAAAPAQGVHLRQLRNGTGRSACGNRNAIRMSVGLVADWLSEREAGNQNCNHSVMDQH